MIYPLKLSYSTAHMLWGGRRLINEWGKKTDADILAETYELSVRNDRKSVIENGKYKGRTLDEYIKEQGNHTVSSTYDGGRFPMLIKFIDAEKSLSVQVHPDDEYAAAVENDSGKNEMWYIVDALPDAKIVYGLREKVTSKELKNAIEINSYDSVLNYINVKKGETYYIPAGLVHAIGAGIVIAEIQQNSDLTYRVYDYDRTDANGNKRELHVEKAFECIKYFSNDEVDKLRFENKADSKNDCIVASRFFKVYKKDIRCSEELESTKESFHAILVISDSAELKYKGIKYLMSKGDCWYIPANSGKYTIEGNATLLISTL